MMKERVGRGWTKFEDYVYGWARYICYTPPGRRVQVGMGLHVGGEPRGEKIAITEQGDFTVIGIGSIHVRLYDDGPDCEVAITRDRAEGIPILRSSF